MIGSESQLSQDFSTDDISALQWDDYFKGATGVLPFFLFVFFCETQRLINQTEVRRCNGMLFNIHKNTLLLVAALWGTFLFDSVVNLFGALLLPEAGHTGNKLQELRY